MKLYTPVCAAVFSLVPLNAHAMVSVVDTGTSSVVFNDGIVGNFSFTVTGGDILLFTAAYDAGIDGVLTGGVTATFDGDSLAPVLTSFRSDGEVGSAIFATIAPVQKTGVVQVDWGVNSGITFSGSSSLSALTLSGVDTTNPFGSQGTNVNLSTGITLNNVEAGNFSLYAIGAQQGLGNPPLDINGTIAVNEPGFVQLHDSIDPGSRTLNAALIQQITGSVSFSHPQTARQAAASAIEINALVPEPSSVFLLMLGSCLGFVRRR